MSLEWRRGKIPINVSRIGDNRIPLSEAGFRDNVIYMPSNLYGCTLGSDVTIGPFVEIQSSVFIGSRTRIQSHTFICSLVDIGEDCFVGHSVTFVNDKFSSGGPAMGDRTKWLRTTIGNRVSIGSGSTLLPVQITDDCVIGAGAVVTKDLLVPGVYVGNPAKLIKNFEK